MQGSIAQFHYGNDEEKKSEQMRFLNSQIKIQFWQLQVHLRGQQDIVFEINNIPENP